jgi:hypothetical protein
VRDHGEDPGGQVRGLLAAATCLVVLGCAVLVVRGTADGGVAIGGAGGSATGGTATVGEQLHGRSFRSAGPIVGAPTDAAEAGVSFGVVSSRFPEPVLIAIADPGCESLAGVYELRDDEVLVVGGEVTADQFCDPAVQGAGDWFIELLRSAPRLQLDGDRLVVEGSAVRVTLEEESDVGEVAGCAAAVGDVVGFLEAFVATVDPATSQPDGSVTGRLDDQIAAAVATRGCPEEEVRRHAGVQLLLNLAGRQGSDWLDGRQTLVSGMLIGLTPEQFGLGTPGPGRTLEPRPPGPTAAPTPTDEGGAAWCGARGLAGVVATTGGALEAVCRDGGARVTIDAGPGWTSVDLGSLRLVAGRSDPDTGERTFTELAVQGAGHMGRAPGTAPALSRGDRLAWITPDGRIVADGVEDALAQPARTPSSVSWDRDGRWLFAVDEDRTFVIATAVDDVDVPVTELDISGLIAMAGEVDTPGTVVLLVDRDGLVGLDAAAVDGSGRPTPFALASTGIPADTYGEASFVEPAGLLRPAPSTGGWEVGTSIGWVIGDGTRAWYVDGLADPVPLGDDIADLALLIPAD